MALHIFSNAEKEAFNSTQRLLDNLAQLVAAGGVGGGGSITPYNDKKVEQIIDPSSGVVYTRIYPANTLHFLDITVVSGNVELAVGTDPAIIISEGVSMRIDATQTINQVMRIDTDPALPINVILTETY